ncbi:MAG: efflux RND transporter periplasmic adaptor subunit [Saprospiraceae bacterium]|nr:efflux RND transporter periplasmic adaptor subunit [Saprospiraceae bacterium]
MKKRQWVVSIILTLLVLLVGTFLFQFFRAQKKSTVSDVTQQAPLRQVIVDSFISGEMSNPVSLDGRINAYEKIVLSAEVTGRLQSTGRVIKEGVRFGKGDVLFQVDMRDAELALFAQRSSLMNAITQMMPDLKFDFPDAFVKWRKYLDDFNVEETLRELPTVVDAKEKYYLASKTIYNQFYSIRAAEDRLSDYLIRAPFSGVVLNAETFPGSLVTPGANLATIMNTGRYELIAPINPSDLSAIRQGQTVRLWSSDKDASWQGRVSRISDQIDQVTQSIPVYISVSGRGLRDGIYVQGVLDGASMKDVVKLPSTAVVDQQYVFMLEDSVVRKRPIEVLKRVPEGAIVRGFTAGQVITEGTQGLFDGQLAEAIRIEQ